MKKNKIKIIIIITKCLLKNLNNCKIINDPLSFNIGVLKLFLVCSCESSTAVKKSRNPCWRTEMVLPFCLGCCSAQLSYMGSVRDCHVTQEQIQILWSGMFLGWAKFRGLQRRVTCEDFWTRHRNGAFCFCCVRRSFYR